MAPSVDGGVTQVRLLNTRGPLLYCLHTVQTPNQLMPSKPQLELVLHWKPRLL